MRSRFLGEPKTKKNGLNQDKKTYSLFHILLALQPVAKDIELFKRLNRILVQNNLSLAEVVLPLSLSFQSIISSLYTVPAKKCDNIPKHWRHS